MHKVTLAEQIKNARDRMAAELILSRQSAATATALELDAGWAPSQVTSTKPVQKVSEEDTHKKTANEADSGRSLGSLFKLNSIETKFSRLKTPEQAKSSNITPFDISVNSHGSIAKKSEYVINIGTPFHHNLKDGERPTQGLINVFYGHLGTITSICTLTTANEVYLFTASVDRTCRMFDTSSAQCIRVFEGHTATVNSIATTLLLARYSESHDTSLLEVPLEERTVKIADRKRETLDFEFDSAPKSMTIRLMYRDTISGDTQLAQAELDVDKVILNGQSAKFIRSQWIQLKSTLLPKNRMTCFPSNAKEEVTEMLFELRWLPGSSALKSGGNVLCATCKEIKNIPLRPAPHPIFISIKISDYSDLRARLVSGSADKTIAIWDTATGVKDQVLRGHSGEVTSVAVVNEYDRQYIFSSSLDQTLRMWSLMSGNCLKSIDSVSLVTSMNILVRELEGKRTVEQEMVTQSCKIFVTMKYEYDHSLGHHSVNLTVVNGQNLPKMNIMDPGIESFVVVQVGEQKHTSPVNAQGSNPAWNFAAQLCVDDLSKPALIKIYRPSSVNKENWIGHAFIELANLTRRRFNEQWYDVDFNPCSALYIAAGCGDCTARIFDVRTSSPIAVLESHEGTVSAVQFCVVQDIEYLVTASYDGWAFLWNLKFLTKPKSKKLTNVDAFGAWIQKRPMKKLGPLQYPISSLFAKEMFGALRVFVGSHDCNTWMWTIDYRKMVDDTKWRAKLQAFLESITCCTFILLCILADVVSAIYFEFAVSNDEKDCFGRQSVTATGITCAVLCVFLSELVAQWVAQGRKYFYPIRLNNYMDVAIIAVSIGVAAFQIESDYTLDVYDADGKYLSPADNVTPAKYPDLCASATSGSSSAKKTQSTFTGIRAVRIIARIAVAIRILRAVIKLHKIASLLGSGKARKFDGHENLVTDVLVVPQQAAPDAKSSTARPKAETEYLFTCSGDSTANMYDILSKTAGRRKAAVSNQELAPSTSQTGGHIPK